MRRSQTKLWSGMDDSGQGSSREHSAFVLLLTGGVEPLIAFGVEVGFGFATSATPPRPHRDNR
jgi:hypothetical protein